MKASLIDLASIADERGLLTAAQAPDQLPFAPIRVFTVSRGPVGVVRGGHAHRLCHQLLIALTGDVLVEWEDSSGIGEVVLDSPSRALYLPPLVWAKQRYLSTDSSLLVLASHAYDQADYIDDPVLAKSLRSSAVRG